VQVTPLEILVAAVAAGEIAAVVATSSAASATEVLRNIFSSVLISDFLLIRQWGNLIGRLLNSWGLKPMKAL
jgi:hypothetical protein